LFHEHVQSPENLESERRAAKNLGRFYGVFGKSSTPAILAPACARMACGESVSTGLTRQWSKPAASAASRSPC